jgi:Inverse autotransporter, beta-domain
MSRIKSLIYSMLIVPAVVSAVWPGSGFLGTDCANWHPSLEFLGRVGNYRKGGGAIVFTPIGQDECKLLFAQAEGGLFRENYVGSFGLGLRKEWCDYAWGLNAFADFARAPSGRSYGQGGIGGEVFGNCVVGRVNLYFPGANRNTINVTETEDFFCYEREQAFWGFDLEGGYGIELGCGQLWGYAGYYRFEPDKGSSENGPRLRLYYTFDDFLDWCPLELTVGSEWEQNSVHGSSVSGVVSLRIPLFQGCNTGRSSSCCCSVWRQMGDRVFRNNSIWTARHVVKERKPDPTIAPSAVE